MQKLAAVEEAKALMNEAQDWSVWHWLTDKRRVRATADRATETLGECEKKVKAAWSEDLKKAYRDLCRNGRAGSIDPELKQTLERVKDAESAAEEARVDAEATFDEAERRLSTDLAREGAQKAIASWVLREKAIRRAEAMTRRK
ncbi:MAG: hypothetical protein C5B51_26240 [Terriglobia bacterium]|nr:MAG: hypothetical protein C5B51_26240 [Terriglobia bacterium]